MDNINGIHTSVIELRPGDVLYHPQAGRHMFVARGPHPIWPQLQAVVWCDPSGNLSVDALSPHQHLTGVITNRDESPEQRGLKFRQWYLERQSRG